MNIATMVAPRLKYGGVVIVIPCLRLDRGGHGHPHLTLNVVVIPLPPPPTPLPFYIR